MIDENGPCWDSHKQVGMKKKNGRLVPNCVPKNEALGKDADIGDYIKDFRKSKAPQFKGKSDKKKQKMAIAAYLDAQESVNEKAYLRRSKKLPNLKVPVKRKPRNNTLAKKIKGEKPKGMIKDDMPANAAGHGGVAGIGVGPDGEPGVRMTRMTDKRRKKDQPPVLLKRFRAYESTECQDCLFDHTIMEAEYQGRKVKLGKPSQGDVKKFKVYVKNPKGNVVKVNFGHGGPGKGKGMSIKKDNPKAKKSFRARHNCDNPGPRHKARYWSCKKW